MQKSRGKKKKDDETACSLCKQTGFRRRKLQELLLNAEFQCAETVDMLQQGLRIL